MITKRPA